MYKVLYVPQLACNLFSVRTAASKGNIIRFGHSRCWIRDRKGELRGMGTLSDKVYQLDCVTVPSEQASFATTKKPSGIDLWHYRIAHIICEQRLGDMASKELADGLKQVVFL